MTEELLYRAKQRQTHASLDTVLSVFSADTHCVCVELSHGRGEQLFWLTNENWQEMKTVIDRYFQVVTP